MKKLCTTLAAFTAVLFTFIGTVNAQVPVYEETFETGPNGWTSVSETPNDTSLWVWDMDGFVGDGALANAIWELGSESMVFNADFYTTQGDPANIPSGPASTYPKYISHLISPTLDLSGVTTALAVSWTQIVRFLNVSPGAPGNFRASISVSTDDGATWSEPIDALPGKAVNTFYDVETVSTVPIPAIQGSSTAKIRFTFSSDFYFWVVDDIQLTERVPHDMQANGNFYAIAPNVWWPVSQLEAFGFLCDIENRGGEDQTNVNLNITITDDNGGAQVYSEDEAYGTIEVDSLAENVSFGSFTPPAGVITSYTGVYTVSADSVDVNPDNNTQSFNFEVTDTIFAKETAPNRDIYPASDNWNVGDPRSWAYGNHYFTPAGDGFFANSATFSIDVSADANAAGQSLQIVLYEWNDVNIDGNADPDERDRVASHLYIIDGSETFDELITVPLTNLFTGVTTELSDDQDYILMIEFIAEDETRVDFGAGSALDYGAMVLNSEQQGNPRYAGMLGIAGDLESESYSSLGFGRNFVPVVRLNIGETPIFSSTQEPIVADAVKVFPNPASDQTQVDLQLPQVSERVEIELLSVTGSQLSYRQIQNVQNVSETINLNGLASGTYFVRVVTDFGYSVTPVIVK
jgi:hypothetical protein